MNCVAPVPYIQIQYAQSGDVDGKLRLTIIYEARNIVYYILILFSIY